MNVKTILCKELDQVTRKALAVYVTAHYLQHHNATASVHKGLDEKRKAVFENTFYEAMLDSFEVLGQHDGVVHTLYDDITEKFIGFSMGMKYSPRIFPLSPAFFEKTNNECKEFFDIFTEANELRKPYFGITEENINAILGKQSLYYMGMTAYRDEDVALNLAQAMYQYVFLEKAFVGIYTLFSDKLEAAVFKNYALKESTIASLPDNQSLRISLIHTGDPIIDDVMALYRKVGESQQPKEPSVATKMKIAHGSPLMTNSEHDTNSAAQTDQKGFKDL